MRFLVDECTGPKVAPWLRSEGYEVFSVYDEARGSEDDEVIQKAYDENWILITNRKNKVRNSMTRLMRPQELSLHCGDF